MEGAYEYAKLKPLTTTYNYPYVGKNGACRDSQYTGIGRVLDYVHVTPWSPSALESAVKNQGPVAVYVNAAKVFLYYTSGIINFKKLCPAKENHAITVVGYGNDGTNEFWICKNSWGSDWGD